MNVSQLAACHRALIQERAAQQQLIDGLEEHGLDTSLTESIGDLSSYDNHPADHGTETYEREKDIGFRDRAERVLEMVEHALQRIENGTYTICDRCGKTINPERLLALPYVTRCIECAEEAEQVDRQARPSEEDLLWPAFGRSFNDGTDKVGYDGEDAWQEVARYGTANSPQDIPDAKDYSDAYIDADEDIGYVTVLDAITGGIQPEDPDDDLTVPDLVTNKHRTHTEDLLDDDDLDLPREGETT